MNDKQLEKWAEGFDEMCAGYGVDSIELLKYAQENGADNAGVGDLLDSGVDWLKDLPGKAYGAYGKLDPQTQNLMLGGAGGGIAGGLAGLLRGSTGEVDEDDTRLRKILRNVAGLGGAGALAGTGAAGGYNLARPHLANLGEISDVLRKIKGWVPKKSVRYAVRG